MRTLGKKAELLKFDYIILLSTIFLVGLGLLFIFSASSYTAQKDFGNKYYFLIKQAIGALVGCVCLVSIYFVNLEKIKRLSIPFALLAMILLGLVFVPKIGIENYGAKRWIGFGSFSFQPSELAKFAFVFFSCVYISNKKVNMAKLTHNLPIIICGVVYCLLIIIEPNMSITVCMGLIMVCMLFVGGMKLKWFFICMIPLLLVVPILIVIEPYRLLRLLAFVNPFASPKDEGYQLIQSLYALGSGGFFGVGLFNSRQKYEFLPFAESDFIFSIIGEETGLFGCIILFGLYFILIFRGIKLAVSCKDRYHTLFASGIISVIAIQCLINFAVVTGSIPPTGLPLPFVSYGGTSLVVFMSSVGILLNISNKCFLNKNVFLTIL
ncbi:MAG: putative lipid II flippase FtsW [Clostridia bacterium]